MSSIALADRASSERAATRRLIVLWQEPDVRSIIPVGVLIQGTSDGSSDHQFVYLRRAQELETFRPFVGFPDLTAVYRSSDLFPFFQNRVMAPTRDDFPAYVASLGLDEQATPFEILMHNEGRRATDTVEMFPEPEVVEGRIACDFFVRGVRHVPGAHDAINRLAVGDHLSIEPQPDNEHDENAVIVLDDGRHLGWVPEFLTPLVHEPRSAFGDDAIEITVARIGQREGPVHQRLLCHLDVRWPNEVGPFSGPEFELAAEPD